MISLSLSNDGIVGSGRDHWVSPSHSQVQYDYSHLLGRGRGSVWMNWRRKKLWVVIGVEIVCSCTIGEILLIMNE